MIGPNLAELGLAIDSSGALTATTRLDALTAAGTRSEAQTKKLTKETASYSAMLRQQASAMLTVEQAIEREMAIARSATGVNNRLADSFARMKTSAAQGQANAMSAMIAQLDPFQKGAANAAVQAEKLAAGAAKSHLSVGQLGKELLTATRNLLGLNPVLAQVGGALGKMAVGDIAMIAILAGIAAVGFAWEKLTEKTRKAKEETQAALKYLEDLQTKQRQGSSGQTGDAKATAGVSLFFVQEDIEKQKAILANQMATQKWAAAQEQLNKDLAEEQRLRGLIHAGDVELAKTRADNNETRAREHKEEMDRLKAEADRLKAQREEIYKNTQAWLERVRVANAQRSGLNGQAIDLMNGDPRSVGLRTSEIAKINDAKKSALNKEFEDRWAALVESSSKEVQLFQEKLAKQKALYASFFKDIFSSALGGFDALFTRVRGMIQDALTSFAAKKMATSMAGFIGVAATADTPGSGANGSIGGGILAAVTAHPFIAAAAGVGLLVGGIVSMNQRAREGAERLKAVTDSLNQSITAMKLFVGEGSELDSALLDLRIKFDNLTSQTEKLMNAAGNRADIAAMEDYAAMLADLQSTYAKSKARLTEYMTAEKELQAQELQVRALRTSGYAADADNLAFAIAQKHEYNEALKNNATQEQLNTLASVQLAEAQARQAETARKQREALEDLNVRMAAALGLDPAIVDGMREQLARQREYEQAVRDGASATYLAALAEVQKAEATAAAITRVKGVIEGLNATIDGLQSFKDQLLLSDVAGQSPTEKLAEAKRQYDAVLAQARGGDAGAAGRLPASAQTYLNLLRQVNASGPAFQSGLQQVLADTDAVMQVFKDQRSIAQKQLDELIAIREIQKAAYDLTALDGTPRNRVPISQKNSANLEATVTVLQAGFEQTLKKLDALAAKMDENTTATRQGFEGASL